MPNKAWLRAVLLVGAAVGNAVANAQDPAMPEPPAEDLMSAEVQSEQIQTTVPLTPAAKVVSPGGVDMRTGEYVPESRDLSIGPEHGGVAFERIPRKFKVFRSNWHYQVTRKTNPEGGYHYQVENREIAKTWFSLFGTTFQEVGFTINGKSKLELISNSYLRYTAPDGTQVRFQGTVNTWCVGKYALGDDYFAWKGMGADQ